MAKVLITGGSGLIGTRLTEILIERGFEVAHLGRSAGSKNGVETFVWDYKTNQIDTKAFAGAEYIINLAGANIAAKRWTSGYRNDIYKSRVRSTMLLIHALKVTPHKIRKMIQASAIGIYKNNSREPWDENALHGETFLSDVCKDWEQSANEAVFIHIQPVTLRIGIVLTKQGGYIAELTRMFKRFIGAIIGSSQQKISWIHLDDLCHMMIHLMIYEKAEGAYNAVAPNPVSNGEITRNIAERLNKKVWLPFIPSFLLRLFLGGITDELTASHNLSSERVANTGFRFEYPFLQDALNEVLPHTKE